MYLVPSVLLSLLCVPAAVGGEGRTRAEVRKRKNFVDYKFFVKAKITDW